MGTWRHAAANGAAGPDGDVTYDDASALFVAHLRHLSAWNIDGDISMGNGGCVRGRLLNACSPTSPVAAVDAYVFFLGPEEITLHLGATGADGRYCQDVGIADRFARVDLRNTIPVPVNVFVTNGTGYDSHTGAQVFNTSSMCNPVPIPFQAPSAYAAYDGGRNFRWSNYGLITTIPDEEGWQYAADAFYPDTCNPATPVANLTTCGFCEGSNPYTHTFATACTFPNRPAGDLQNGGLVPTGSCSTNCADLGDAYVRPAGCNCAMPLDTTPCTQRAGCCPDPGGKRLTCIAATGRCQACIAPGDSTLCTLDSDCCPAPSGQPMFCQPATRQPRRLGIPAVQGREK